MSLMSIYITFYGEEQKSSNLYINSNNIQTQQSYGMLFIN